MAAVAPISLRASGRLRRRQLVNRIMETLATAAAILAIIVLGIVIFTVGRKGVGSLNLALFTQNEKIDFLHPGGGGIAFAFVGTAMLVGIATIVALPLGVLTALCMTEFAKPSAARIFRTGLDVLNGIPSIVIGIFVYGLIVLRFGQSALAGGVALAIIMLPLVARATQEVLLLVPQSIREASLALGVSRWRTTLSIVLPSALGGILTGTTLAIARAAGETAPLLFASSLGARDAIDWNPTHPVTSLTLTIFEYSDQADPSFQSKAWAAAFILMVFVLVTSLSAKLLLARTRRKLST
jgi:phosphate transport system permease protein